MIVKIERKKAIEEYPKLPLSKWNQKEKEFDYYFPEIYRSYVLTLPSKSYRGQIKLMGIELRNLTEDFGFDKLIFLGDVNTPWLKREHNFKPAKEALQYLADNKLGKRFDGALQINASELPAFIVRLAWLVRTNAVLPHVYFIDPKQSFIGTICQYGNLHFSTISKEADEIFKTEISKTKFEFITEYICYDKFSKSNVIKGRQIML